MRILHTMLRVGNLQRAIDFYTGVFGMKLLRQSDNPEYKYTLAFVGFSRAAAHEILRETCWGVLNSCLSYSLVLEHGLGHG